MVGKSMRQRKTLRRLRSKRHSRKVHRRRTHKLRGGIFGWSKAEKAKKELEERQKAYVAVKTGMRNDRADRQQAFVAKGVAAQKSYNTRSY